jgi:MOSC domain-containing protein YiiM
VNVVSVNIGGRSRLSLGGESVASGIFKSPTTQAYLTRTGFRGDVQVDIKNHGGVDKAVCVYSGDHFLFWKASAGQLFGPGAFGENLTVTGLVEDDVRIGDVYSVGETQLQVSQPRQPCHKLSKKVGDPAFAGEVIKTGLTGFYFRVLVEGIVGPGDVITRISSEASSCTIRFANDVMYRNREGAEDIEKLLSEPFLSDAWKGMLSLRCH